MLLYLDHAWDKFKAQQRMNTMKDLHDAVMEGAVQRIRPKIMTVCAILFGLLPIMWSPTMQAGADVMKRIATPMIGGVVTSAILELLIYPVIYVIWRRRELPEKTEEEPAPLVPPALVPSRVNRQRALKWIAIVVVALSILYIGSKVWQNFAPRFGTAAAAHSEPLVTQTVNDLTVKIFGDLRSGQSDLILEFRDAAGELVDVGRARFDMTMNMPGMTMHDSGKIQSTGKPGQYRVRANPSMAGDWAMNLSYDGPRGHGETVISLSVKANK
jgi:Putative silver efflux pump